MTSVPVVPVVTIRLVRANNVYLLYYKSSMNVKYCIKNRPFLHNTKFDYVFLEMSIFRGAKSFKS